VGISVPRFVMQEIENMSSSSAKKAALVFAPSDIRVSKNVLKIAILV
jgi:hypothetical protein